MPEHIWTLCCENAIIDSRTNNLSLINLLEQLNVPPGAKVIGMRMMLVTLWSKSQDVAVAERFRSRALWELPGGERIFGTEEMEQEIPADTHRLRVLLEVGGVPFREGGYYHFVVEKMSAEDKWETVTRLPLEVVVKEE
jgi:hypothetical protein